MGNETLPQIRNFSYDCSCKRAPVPKSTERPIYGVKSNKDFIVTNAIETILSTPRRNKEEMDWMHKKDFGKNPEYLDSVKANIQREYDMIQNLHNSNQKERYLFLRC